MVDFFLPLPNVVLTLYPTDSTDVSSLLTLPSLPFFFLLFFFLLFFLLSLAADDEEAEDLSSSEVLVVVADVNNSSMVYCNYIEHSIINPTLNENNELSSCVSMQ